ncbi:hypothetical protein QGM71_13770 [Virgibacillus sp. C22-A2]|uniref:Uncharacterized protein n=1 Tax=Virgibacillus tibetensis TaxID=3042313 RepID=A0ABU6KJK4_9BACI|nr:hypothetical protein [Virgibacillus sp. C22-A2]
MLNSKGKNSKPTNLKNRDYYFQKNEEQLQREKIVLNYDYIRSAR